MSAQATLRRPAATARALSTRRLPAAVPICACLTSVVAVLLIAEVSAVELLLFAGFQIAYALFPGFLSYLLLVGRQRSPLEALALAMPIGMAIQIGCFVLSAAIGERWLFFAYPVPYALVTALYARRHALKPRWPARRKPGVSPVSALAAFAVTVVATLVVYGSLFAASPLPRDVHSASYYPDLIYNLSLASEILHHWPPMNPSVSGVALHYHIFVNIHSAATAQVTHIALASIVLRLEPALLVAVIGLQLFVLGRRLTGSAAAGSAIAGFAALALGLLAGELNFSSHVLAGGGLPAIGLLLSPSYLLGAVFFLAVLGVLIDGLRGGSPARHAALLGLLGFGAVGAKVTVVPVLLGGLALFALGLLPRPRSLRPRVSPPVARTVAVGLAVLGAIAVGGYLLLYRGGGEGVKLKPLDFLSYSGFASVYQRAHHSPLYALAACLAAVTVLCALMLPLAGALLVRDRWLPRRAAGTPERLLVCMLAASLPPFALLAVPGDSESYFVVYGFLAAVLVSAEGITRALSALAPGGRVAGSHAPARSVVAAAALVVLVCLTIASEIFEQTAPTIGHLLRGQPTFQASGAEGRRGITAEELRGLTWVSDHTPTSAVIAVNNHQLGGDNGGSRYLYYSALAERRVFLESWQYTPQGAEYSVRGDAASPFPRMLALNEAAVTDASPAAISLLRHRYGVRYIVIDRLHGPSSPRLGRFARLLYANPAIEVYGLA